METRKLGTVSLCFFENLLNEGGVKHFVTTRMGRRAYPHRDDLNLSFNTGDSAAKILKNRKRLSQALNIPLGWITTGKQVHGHSVRILSRSDRGKGAWSYAGALEATDALVTDLPGICPMVLAADCVPMLMYDPVKRVIAAVHAGWRGTLDLIGRRTVEVFEKDFGSSPGDIIAGIGPSIGPCCYYVGSEVITRAEAAFGSETGCTSSVSSKGGYLDLWKANHDQLLQAGLASRHIEIAGICTAHPDNGFFSYRKEGNRAGRFGAGIYLNET